MWIPSPPAASAQLLTCKIATVPALHSVFKRPSKSSQVGTVITLTLLTAELKHKSAGGPRATARREAADLRALAQSRGAGLCPTGHRSVEHDIRCARGHRGHCLQAPGPVTLRLPGQICDMPNTGSPQQAGHSDLLVQRCLSFWGINAKNVAQLFPGFIYSKVYALLQFFYRVVKGPKFSHFPGFGFNLSLYQPQISTHSIVLKTLLL